MDAELNGGIHPFCNSRTPRANRFGKGNMEWDLNGWMWDGNLFVATPVNAALSDFRNRQLFPTPALGSLSNRSPSSSGESDPGINVNGKGELEKRRREVLVVDDDEPEDEPSSLTLKLGGRVYPVTGHGGISNGDDKNGKRSKVQVVAVCQVEGCGAELSEAKDYHRRHKVCEMHAKASKALVGKVLQRFCQQCSRFHLLQEFDEGKRSCRRRLAGHNKRRRKNQPDPVSNATSLVDERAGSYLLISLLRILTNLHSNGSHQVNDQDLLPHLLKNLGSLAGSLDMNNIPGILRTSQEEENIGTCAGPLETGHASPSNCVAVQESFAVCSDAKINYTTEIQGSFTKQPNQAVCVPVASANMPCQVDALAPGSTVGKVRFRSFDLNDVYNNEHDIIEVPERFNIQERQSPGSLHLPSWMLNNSHKSSPPQTSGNSDSTSVQSQSTSNGEAQSRTDRMIFKLFGKDPSNFPLALRSQILDWLSNSPTDMEGYIRPGCIILTVYLRLPESRWTELYHNLRTCLERLLDVAGDNFWRTGWLYARIRNQIAFAYNGCVVLDTPLLDVHNNCQISSVTPIAVSSSERVKFTVRGVNLTQSSIRLLCAFDGKYLVQEMTQPLACGSSNSAEYDDQCLHISCSVPSATGRGFIEVEDHGLSCSFFPFIVAEKEVSSEICALECAFNMICSDENVDRMKARVEALDFLHEMGWLLRRSHLRLTSEGCNSYASMYPLVQFIWLIEFAIGRSWCAVVKKLLDILFGGVVNTDGKSIELALSDMALLHNAVQQNQTSVVKLLLEYMPPYEEENSPPQSTQMKQSQKGLLFRPDVLGPFDLTPLHIAASRCDAKNLLDALTDDPGRVGIKAWKTARDSSGFTPEDYARSKGYESYIRLMEKKAKQGLGSEHVIVDISGISADMEAILKPTSGPVPVKTKGSLQVHKSAPFMQSSCRTCPPMRRSYGIHHSNLAYRPTMLFMVGIAAVCVCVGILLHSPPEVFSAITPFQWELLDFGYI